MKKTISLILAAFILLFSIPIRSYAEEPRRVPVRPQTKYVDEIVTAKMMANGAYGRATFRIKGKYTVDPTGIPMSESLSVSLNSKPSDWKVVYQYSKIVSNGRGYTVTIYYYFIPPYYDNVFGSGPQYRSVRVGV